MRCKSCDKIIEDTALDPKLELCNNDFKSTREDLIDLLGEEAKNYDLYGDLSYIEEPKFVFSNPNEPNYTAKDKKNFYIDATNDEKVLINKNKAKKEK